LNLQPAYRGGRITAMCCNLQQNPLRRPIVASWLPALLRQGTMFMLHLNGHPGEERWLLEEECHELFSPISHFHFLLFMFGWGNGSSKKQIQIQIQLIYLAG